MEKGAKLVSAFQFLDKLTLRESCLSCCSASDEYQQLRSVTSKILNHVSAQEKYSRDIILKNTDYLDRLLHVLEHSKDKVTTFNVIYILTEVVSHSSNNKQLSVLVAHGATQVLLHVLVNEAKQTDCSEDLLICLHQLIAKLGPKDRKFGVKARLYQALGVSLNLLRNYISQPRVLLPVITVLKSYAADAVNASFLGKNGAVSQLFKVFTLCQHRHLILLKCSLETLSHLVKSKSNAARAIGQGGVSVLLGIFSEWHRLDTKNRHIGIRKAVLSVLKNITNLKSGCEALVEADGVRVLYLACQETIDCRELESLVYAASIIMRKCFPRNHLPLTSLKNPLVFHLPSDDFPENADSADAPQTKETGYESSLDNDDDISSDDDRELLKTCDSDDEGDSGLSYDISYQQNWDDLIMYKPFFTELHEYDALIECDEAANSLQNLSSSTSCFSVTKPSCHSPVDLCNNCSSVVMIQLEKSALDESYPCISENLQQGQRAGSKLGMLHLSVPDSFHSQSDKLSASCNGNDAPGNFWPMPLIHDGDTSPKTSKKKKVPTATLR